MRISVRTLTGEAAELDLAPQTTVAQLRGLVQGALNIPASEQRFVYAGTQLEEEVTPAWRARRARTGSQDFTAALGVASLADGTPLTLEHHGLQKGSVINVVRKAIAASASPAPASPSPAAASAGSPEVVTPGAPAPMGGASTAPSPALGSDVAADLGYATPPPVEVAAGTSYAGDPMKQPFVGREPTASAGSGGVAATGALSRSLDGLSDFDLLRLLSPLLQRRPAVRAALLAEDQAPTVSPMRSVGPEAPRAPQAPGQGPAGASRGVPFPVQSAGYAIPPRYARGDTVSVWSNSAQRWFHGEVVQVMEAAGDQIPQGSVEVAFDLGRKWIAPADLPRVLAPR